MNAEDKHGNPLKVGDTVTFVYGGDHHEADITEITDAGPPEAPRHYITATIELLIPVASATKIVARKKAPDPAETKAREEASSPAPAIKKMQDLAKHDETREKDPSKPSTVNKTKD